MRTPRSPTPRVPEHQTCSPMSATTDTPPWCPKSPALEGVPCFAGPSSHGERSHRKPRVMRAISHGTSSPPSVSSSNAVETNICALGQDSRGNIWALVSERRKGGATGGGGDQDLRLTYAITPQDGVVGPFGPQHGLSPEAVFIARDTQGALWFGDSSTRITPARRRLRLPVTALRRRALGGEVPRPDLHSLFSVAPPRAIL